MRIRTAVPLLLALVALHAGCGTTRRNAEPAPAPGPVTLEIRNHNWADVTVYAVRSGQRMRLATVTATNSSSLILPPEMVGPGGEVRIYAQAIGGSGRFLSPRVYASPGGVVMLELDVSLRRSTITAW
jgi:hypothetical protein